MRVFQKTSGEWNYNGGDMHIDNIDVFVNGVHQTKANRFNNTRSHYCLRARVKDINSEMFTPRQTEKIGRGNNA